MIPSLAYTEALRGNIMAQRKPEEPITLEQVLRLVEKLSPEDQQKLLLRWIEIQGVRNGEI
jgi:hypothetical protein